MTNEELLEEIFRIYQPQQPAGPPEYRVYYDAVTKEIICFSQEHQDHPFALVTKEVYETYRPDLYRIVDGKAIPKKQYLGNRLQLRKNGSIFASVKNDMQFAVPKDWNGDKTYWDIND